MTLQMTLVEKRDTHQRCLFIPPSSPPLLFFLPMRRTVCNKTGLSFAGLEMLQGEAEGGAGGEGTLALAVTLSVPM